MARLGEILRSEKVLTARELDAALENHVLHGVKLGTCLVEMGVISDDVLAKCLGAQTGKAFLSSDQLLAIGTRHLSDIPPVWIKKQRLVPAGRQGGTLRIAADHEVTPQQRAEIEKHLGRKIELVAVSGYAVDTFLEQMFGILRPGRFLPHYSKLKRPEEPPGIVEKHDHEAAQIVIDGIEWKRLGEVTQDDEYAGLYEETVSTPPGRADVPLSLSDAAEQLSRATSRDDIAKAVLEYCSGTSETVALVIIRDGLVRGWKACSDRKMLPEFESFISLVDSIPELQQCVATKKTCIEHSVSAETKLFLRKPHLAGEGTAFFPIFIKQRVVAVLMCVGSGTLNQFETAVLCRKASYALEILILRSKILSL